MLLNKNARNFEMRENRNHRNLFYVLHCNQKMMNKMIALDEILASFLFFY